MEGQTPNSIAKDWLVEKLPYEVMWLNMEGKIIYANDKFCKKLGYSKSEVLKLSIYDINPTVTEKSWSDHTAIVEKKKVFYFKATHKSKSGKYFESEVFAQLFSNDRKKFLCAIVNDITESGFYKKLINSTAEIANAGGWSLDLQDSTIMVTKETLNIFNTSHKKDLLPGKVLRFFVEEEKVKQLFRDAIQKGVPFDDVLQTRENPPRYIRMVGKPVLKGNKIYRIIGIYQDVTRQKTREKSLKLFREIIDNSEDMICVYNRKGDLVQYNESLSAQLGFSRSELDTFTIFNLDPGITPEWWETHFNKIIEQGSMRFEWLAIRKDNTKLPVEINANHLEYDNQHFNCAILRDITIRKSNELKLYQALEEINTLKQKLEVENEYLQEEISNKVNFGNYDQIICKSDAYKKILNQITQVSSTDTTVLITGESGTGKELVARAIHNNSKRKDRPLIKINCATLPKELIESELFGHKKGAFTGAVENKTGKFALADKGTIFLDEIGEMPLELQPKLLRVLQEGEFDELGGTKTIAVNVRVIAATNRDLAKMVAEGTFREDLFYRLNVFPIHNIPLRARREDIPLLAKYFLKKYSNKAGKAFKRLSKKTIEALMSYNFPGNIRELENLIERAIIIEDGTTLNPGSWLPENNPSNLKGDFIPFEDMQKKYIINVLQHTNWRVSGPKGAASILEINDKTLFAKMKRLGIEKKIVSKD